MKEWWISKVSRILLRRWVSNAKLISLDSVLNKYSKFHILHVTPISLFFPMFSLKTVRNRKIKSLRKVNSSEAYLSKSTQSKMSNLQVSFPLVSLKSRLSLAWEKKMISK